MKKLLVLAFLLAPAAVFAVDGAMEQSPSPTPVSERATADNPIHEGTETTGTNPLYEGSDKPAPTPRPVATPGDCDDANCDKVAPTKKPTPRPCTDNDEDCDSKIAPSPLDDDSDGDTVEDDAARQTPKRDFGDRMKAGLHSIGSFFSRIIQWGHSAAQSIIQNIKG